MKSIRIATSAFLVLAAFSPAVLADGRNPGSVLVFPVHRSGFGADGTGWFTVLSVTNINTAPQTPNSFGGSTLAHYEYVNTVYNPADPQLPLACTVWDRVEFLTPADTLSVATTCHNATAGQQQGYVVVSAQNPNLFDVAWSHNYLIGSELVLNGSGGMYGVNAIPFEAVGADGTATDLDGDSQLDFNGVEYEGVPETLYIDSYIALANSQLALINLTGGANAIATVMFDAWNDNEFPLSATKVFRCWFDQPLANVSPMFTAAFLANNTPDDPQELDLNCDQTGDIETGWARINGVIAQSPFAPAIANPAILGCITAGPATSINGGHLLWESKAKQLNGTFMDP